MKKGIGRKGKKHAARGMSFGDTKSFHAATHSGMSGRKKAKLGYIGGKRKRGF